MNGADRTFSFEENFIECPAKGKRTVRESRNVWEPSDIELMLRVKAGEMAAFRQLTARYRDPLRRFFSAILEDRSLAEDYTQETFLRLWFTRERYEPTGKFSTLPA